MKLASGTLAAAELAINRLLDKQALVPLAGLVLELQCQELSLFVLSDATGLCFKPNWQGRVDCRLSAPASAWLGLLRAADKAARVQAAPFVLEGSQDLPLQLLHILQSQPLDLAHELSRLAGPLPAALLESATKHSGQFVQQASASLEQSLVEYLTTETALLPSRYEADMRLTELDDLEQRLTALEQRINRL